MKLLQDAVSNLMKPMKKRKREADVEKEQRGLSKIEKSLYTNRVPWVRGPLIGKGTFGSVYLAFMSKPTFVFKDFPPHLAVKSTENFEELMEEKSLLIFFKDCPFIIKYYGSDLTELDKGRLVFNVFMEFATGGSIGDLLRRLNGIGMREELVKMFIESSLRGLKYIHEKGFVHCDIKPDNILLVANENSFVAKIGDLGSAKSIQMSKDKYSLRGTTTYYSPETAMYGIQGPPADIWALGCTALNMLTGKPQWNHKPGASENQIIGLIAVSKSPKIPSFISEEAKDFLMKCFVRNHDERFTADMLLDHPFLSGVNKSDVDDHFKREARENLDDIKIDQVSFSDSNSPDVCCSFIPLGKESEKFEGIEDACSVVE